MDLPQIGFGTYRLFSDTIQSIEWALANGYTSLDTAPSYNVELLVGESVYQSGINRRNLFLTTKVSKKELELNMVWESVDRSLYDMRLDYLDLVLLHAPIDPINNWRLLCEYQDTVGRNKVLNIGVSNFDQQDIMSIVEAGLPIPQYNQIELNPFHTQSDLVEFCVNNGIRVVAHSPLAKAEKMNNPVLNYYAQKYNSTCAQIMLQWGKQKQFVIIPRSKDESHIQENISSSFEISSEDMEELNQLDCQYATHPMYLRSHPKYFLNKKSKNVRK